MKRRVLGLILIGILSVSFVGCSSNKQTTSQENNNAQEQSKSEETKKDKKNTFSFNEAITLDHYEGGNYIVTFEGIRVTDDRNEFSELKPKKVILVDYNFENKNVPTDVFVAGGFEYKVSDGEGNMLQSYPVSDDTRISTSCPEGAKSMGTEAFAIESESNEVKIIVYNKDKVIGEIKTTIP